jgi:hypothetical protein
VGRRCLSVLQRFDHLSSRLLHFQTYYNNLDAYQQQQNPKQAHSAGDSSISLAYSSQPSEEALHASHELLLAACRLPPRQGLKLLPITDIRPVRSASVSPQNASAGAGCREAELVIPGLGMHVSVISILRVTLVAGCDFHPSGHLVLFWRNDPQWAQLVRERLRLSSSVSSSDVRDRKNDSADETCQ